MTQAVWIIIAVIAVVAILLVALMLHRKPVRSLPGETVADDLLPEQVTPEPVAVEPAPPPQTVAAEETPPARPVQAELAIDPVPAPVAAPPSGDEDNLLKLKGVGPKIAAILKAQGITRFAQIAGWSDADIAAIDASLGSFAGRPKRDNWVDQAQFLAAGDVAGYEGKYGKL